jgi:hypothetical protein
VADSISSRHLSQIGSSSKALSHKDILGSGGTTPVILTSALDRRLGGTQKRSGRCVEEKYLALPGIESGPPNP